MEFQPGDLAFFSFCKESEITDVGFSTFSLRKEKIYVPEIIDLFSFPSWNDFKGNLYRVKERDIILIIKKIGRPTQISSHSNWEEYDVYSVYINGKTCQMFKKNLKRINK